MLPKPKPKPKPAIYSLSDEAFHWWITSAHRLNYVATTKHANGLSAFITDMAPPAIIYSDTRPTLTLNDPMFSSILSTYFDTDTLWQAHASPRMPRSLSLPNQTISSYSSLAFFHHILEINTRIPRDIPKTNTKAYAANALEAIGLNLLTPTSYPSPLTKARYILSHPL